MIPVWRKPELKRLVYKHLDFKKEVVDEVIDELFNCLVEIAGKGEAIAFPDFGTLLPLGKVIKKKLRRTDGKVVDFEGLSIHYKFKETYDFRLKMREFAKKRERDGLILGVFVDKEKGGAF